jgi:hypothetical protein
MLDPVASNVCHANGNTLLRQLLVALVVNRCAGVFIASSLFVSAD